MDPANSFRPVRCDLYLGDSLCGRPEEKVVERLLEEFRRQYGLEQQWSDIKAESRPFELQEYQWWDWYYYDQFNWRSMTPEAAKLVYPEIKEKPRKK